MAAYLYATLELTDPELYAEYRRDVPALIAAQGGRYLARGGTAQYLEGVSPAQRHVIVEFPDMARLRAWYDDPAYQRLKTIRQRTSHGLLVAIEGV